MYKAPRHVPNIFLQNCSAFCSRRREQRAKREGRVVGASACGRWSHAVACKMPGQGLLATRGMA
jgi:hypothetical protein